MSIFGSIPPESKSTFPFHYNIIFETYQFLEPHSSSPEGDRYFCPLNFVQDSIRNNQFFDIMGNFGSIDPSGEPTFPFPYIIIFQR